MCFDSELGRDLRKVCRTISVVLLFLALPLWFAPSTQASVRAPAMNAQIKGVFTINFFPLITTSGTATEDSVSLTKLAAGVDAVYSGLSGGKIRFKLGKIHHGGQ